MIKYKCIKCWEINAQSEALNHAGDSGQCNLDKEFINESNRGRISSTVESRIWIHQIWTLCSIGNTIFGWKSWF
jgi:hypothetical protein